MFGLGRAVCAVCEREARKKGSVRGYDRKDLVICSACYTKWYGAGAECAECHTRVRGIQEAGVFLERQTFGHIDCGAIRVRD